MSYISKHNYKPYSTNLLDYETDEYNSIFVP